MKGYVYDPYFKKRHARSVRKEYQYRDPDEITTTDVVLGLSGVLFLVLCVVVYIKTGGIC